MNDDKRGQQASETTEQRLARRRTVDDMLAERQKVAFEKAEKIPASEYKGWVSVPGCEDEDGYFESVTELLSFCASTGQHAPVFVWACAPVLFRLDADAIVEQALEDHREGAKDNIPDEAIERLQLLLDGWTQATGIVSQYEDQTRAVMIGGAP